MNILYLYQYFGTPNGGWSTRVYEMCKRWVQQGNNVTVLTTPYDKSDIRATKFIEHQHYDGIHVIVVNLVQSNKHSLIRRMYTFCMFSLISIYFVLRLKYDAVIASSGPITIGIPGVIAARIRRKPLVFEVRDLWPRGAVELQILKNTTLIKIAFFFERLCYASSKLIVACSQGMADDILRRYPSSKVIIVPNACDIELFQRAVDFKIPSFVNNRSIILYTGSIGLMDDCSQIIEGARVLAEQSFEKAVIIFLGEGAERKMLEEKTRSLGLSNVFFLGLVPKTEVIGWLQKATATLVVFKNVPVLDTSSPNKFFDSLAAGIPVIQTTKGWLRDVIEQSRAGINVQVNNPSSMAAAIQQICSDVNFRNSAAENAQQLAKQKFDRDILARYMVDEINNVIK